MLALPRRQLARDCAAAPIAAGEHHTRPQRPGAQTRRQAPSQPDGRHARAPLTEEQSLMPHTKCLHCRARVWRDNSADQPTAAADLCPGCGGELEPVADLSELVGLRALRVRPRQTHRDSAERFERISQEIREAFAAHDAERRRQAPSDSL
ncbi:MAG TPA: hypothetical protein VNS09_01160 [Solirubrobacter sp.]|nr:hypothetical protein [Solirubrobacter sp.]